MDTSNFTTNKEGGDNYKDCRKAMQAAYKDINAVLEPKPKMNIMDATAAMPAKIVDVVGACIGEDEKGNSIWADPRGAKLNADTIAVYNWALSLVEPAEEPETVQPGAEAGPAEKAESEIVEPEPWTQPAEDVYLADNEECPGWVKKLGPSAEYEEICKACARLKACTERMGAKPAAGAKKEGSRRKKKDSEPKQTKPGVIASILAMLKSGPHSKDEILDKLKVQFPDRNEKSMKSTINVQIPSRMAKEKNVTINKNDSGQYFIA